MKRSEEEECGTGHGVSEVGAAAGHLLQRLLALVGGRALRGGQGGGGGAEALHLDGALLLDGRQAAAGRGDAPTGLERGEQPSIWFKLCAATLTHL